MIRCRGMETEKHPTKERGRDRAALVGLLLALVASLVLLFAPTGTSVSACSRTVNGSPNVRSQPVQQPCGTRVSHPSLVQSQGWGVAIPLAVPVAIAAAGLAVQRTRLRRPGSIVAGILLSILVVLGAFSIGIFYLPAAVAMFLAADQRRVAAVAT